MKTAQNATFVYATVWIDIVYNLCITIEISIVRALRIVYGFRNISLGLILVTQRMT